MNFLKRYVRESVLAALVLANIFVWSAVYERRPTNLLHVYFLDIGQGDAIFVDSPTHGRLLIDGGPDQKVETELGKILPFGDRRIDVVAESHPDADHITGLVSVLRDYKVGAFLEPGVDSTNHVHVVLENEVSAAQIPHLLARRGMSIGLGGGVSLLVLFPNQDVTNWDTNDASIVAKLVYGDESFLLTGDSTKKAEYILLGLNATILKSTVLKAGHHGSATSSSVPYIQAVAPEYAVISAGAGNSYGLPKQVTLDNLKAAGAKIVSTESAGGLTGLGTIEFDTNGENLVLK